MTELKAGSNLERVFEAGHFAITAELGPPKSADAKVIKTIIRYPVRKKG